MVYYRKYRPQTIDELDNSEVRERLTNLLSRKEPPHAFLFTGPKGLGKTSSARIVAKALNCERRNKRQVTSDKEKKRSNERVTGHMSHVTSVEPCNECDTCVSITKGTNIDVLEIDAASNRGIDEIRDLREKIRLAPVVAQKKVYIIDEVHMLTTEAFNALLKILEEPPTHAYFVLATTEPQKIPDTILSRCQHVVFHKATEEELVRSFKRIVAAENITVSDEVLKQIASLSDGGFRDGAKVLEELASTGEAISEEALEKQFHTKSIEQSVTTLFELLDLKKLKESVEIVESVAKDGTNMQYFLEHVIDRLHRKMLLAANGEKQRFTLAEFGTLFALLSDAYQQTKLAVVPQLPLELAIISYLRVDQEVAKPSSPAISSENDLQKLRKKVGELSKKQAFLEEKVEPVKEETVVATSRDLLSHRGNGEVTPEWQTDFWQSYLAKLKEYNHTISGVLRGCRIRAFDRKTLVIETAYEFHKDRLSHQKTIAALEEAAAALTGNPVAVRVELKNGK